jgi:hypothetical protein
VADEDARGFQNRVVDTRVVQKTAGPDSIITRLLAGHRINRMGQGGMGLIAFRLDEREQPWRVTAGQAM